jgi:hypothetical protein
MQETLGCCRASGAFEIAWVQVVASPLHGTVALGALPYIEHSSCWDADSGPPGAVAGLHIRVKGCARQKHAGSLTCAIRIT